MDHKLKNHKLLFVGAGNMAEALIQGLLTSRKMAPSQIFFTEINADRRQYIEQRFKIQCFSSNQEAAALSDIILFAVKPQGVESVLADFKNTSLKEKLFISILAGTPIRKFENYLGAGTRVIRVMPNMASLIGEGIAGLSRGRFASETDEDMAAEIMSSTGDVVKVQENMLDAVTAVSGSGPAYFFYFIEALQQAAIELGLPLETASKLVLKTALGAGHLASESKDTPEVLRKKVTSPGGTTEAAIKAFDLAAVKEHIIEGVKAACNRSQELSGGA
jgi:pyrroline-5-carboxylate reductase